MYFLVNLLIKLSVL